MEIQARIKFRRDTQANWTMYNPILLDGELGLVTDGEPLCFKIGDGATAFLDLPIASGAAGIGGKSAYELAVEQGFEGDENEWLTSLVGSDGQPGIPGKSAYEIAVETGFVGTEAEWLQSLKGADGETGQDGTPGAAATIAVGIVTTGEPGTDASVVNVGTANAAVLDIAIPRGTDGEDGREIELINDGTYIKWRYAGETDWQNIIAAADLKGADGADGSDGTAPTITVGTVITLPAGEAATVEVDESSTDANIILNFGIPEGPSGSSSGSNSNYHQSNVLNAPANTNVVLTVNNPQTRYIFSPPMVLKFTPAGDTQTITAFGFSEGDAEDWLIGGQPAEDDGQTVFDGTMRLRTEYSYDFGEPQPLGDTFVSESTEIDLSKFTVLSDMQ
jgi:hypothetical protein